jgi:hypothetical protein
MTTGSPARVRPGFRRYAIAVFIILVPIALHTAWDHYEARRLARRVAEIRGRNEPIANVPNIGSARVMSSGNAARYYEAAAALVDVQDFYGPSGLLNRMDNASEQERPRIVQEVRALLEHNREAEALLARATDLPFEGYAAGTSYSYRGDRLSKLARLASLRALERLEDGNADAAADAIVQQLRINRPMTVSGFTDLSIIGLSWAATPALREIGRFLGAGPSDASLQRVQKAIRELDNDSMLERAVVSERAFMLGMFWNEGSGWFAPQRNLPNGALFMVMRPLVTRQFIGTVDILTALVEQSRRPWPTRLHIDVVDNPPRSRSGDWWALMPWTRATQTLGTSYRRRAANVATALALGRTADAAIAAERYRRATGRLPETLEQLVPAYLPKVPVDPYSGREIRYVRTAVGATAYSLGTNERDDGGTKLDDPRWRKGGVQYTPPDFGVAIHVAPRGMQ